MSGHSKWSTIKRQKGAADAKKGALFTKLGNAIALAARGGADPSMNPTLAMIIDKAKKSSMPMANIQRSIDRGAGKLGGAVIEEATYEAYGPGGTAIIIECATDNKNRSLTDVKTALSKNGGTFAESGSVSYLFERKGIVRFKKSGDDDADQLSAIDAGAEDVFDEDDIWAVYTDPRQLHSVSKALTDGGASIESSELAYVPKSTVAVGGDAAEKVIKLMDTIDELDDVTNTYSNFDLKE